jgi:uncharacterized protein YuzE
VVSVTYDPSAKSLYINLDKGVKIAKTIPLGEGKYMDVSEDGSALGLEIVFAQSTPEEALQAIIKTKEPVKVLA